VTILVTIFDFGGETGPKSSFVGVGVCFSPGMDKMGVCIQFEKKIRCTHFVRFSIWPKVTVFGSISAKFDQKSLPRTHFCELRACFHLNCAKWMCASVLCRNSVAFSFLTAPAHFLCLKIALGDYLGDYFSILGGKLVPKVRL
jgi:hypothetical protein